MKFSDSYTYEKTILTADEIIIMNRISSNLQLSFAMDRILEHDLLRIKRSGRDLFSTLYKHIDLKAQNRKEGKVYFNRIREEFFKK